MFAFYSIQIIQNLLKNRGGNLGKLFEEKESLFDHYIKFYLPYNGSIFSSIYLSNQDLKSKKKKENRTNKYSNISCKRARYRG